MKHLDPCRQEAIPTHITRSLLFQTAATAVFGTGIKTALVHHGKDCTGEKEGIDRKYGRLREREGERGRGQKKTRETVRDCQKGAV